MNTGLWNMDSGLAAAQRPGMTIARTVLLSLAAIGSISSPVAGAPASQYAGETPIFIGPEAAGYQMQVMDADDRPR